ncbi:hypothetical protein [Micromonospora sp. NPDC049645]|uniref:hypothetical protein n=1 Tax=Micromonospora sp. NPDC049645 TaxID=3155508 RepID=UPI00341DB596
MQRVSVEALGRRTSSRCQVARPRQPDAASAAVCVVMAGTRSRTAIAEWVDGVPAATVVALGCRPGHRPSGAMIRRLRQALDPDLLTAAIGSARSPPG